MDAVVSSFRRSRRWRADTSAAKPSANGMCIWRGTKRYTEQTETRRRHAPIISCDG
jgi:hypothetical protein